MRVHVQFFGVTQYFLDIQEQNKYEIFLNKGYGFKKEFKGIKESRLLNSRQHQYTKILIGIEIFIEITEMFTLLHPPS